MENNEVMNYEENEVMDEVIVEDGGSGIGTGVAMLIGAGLACAVGAGVKLVKHIVAKHKAKKELRKPEAEINLEPEDVEELAEAE